MVSPKHDSRHSTQAQRCQCDAGHRCFGALSAALQHSNDKVSTPWLATVCAHVWRGTESESGEHRILRDVNAENAPPLPKPRAKRKITFKCGSSSSLTTIFWKPENACSHGFGEGRSRHKRTARDQVSGITLSGGTEIVRLVARRHLLQGLLTSNNNDYVGTSAKLVLSHKTAFILCLRGCAGLLSSAGCDRLQLWVQMVPVVLHGEDCIAF